MNPSRALLLQTRRHFFHDCAIGLGSLALASLLSDGKLLSAKETSFTTPLAPNKPPFPARAKSVIYLFMAGGPRMVSREGQMILNINSGRWTNGSEDLMTYVPSDPFA